jgi:lambda family phage portal protein
VAKLNLLDRLVGYGSPERALARAQARERLAVLEKAGIHQSPAAIAANQIARAFQAAANDRMTATWVPGNASPDAMIALDGRAVRERSRDLIANNGFARGAQNAIVANTVGNIRPLPHKIASREQKRQVLEAWDRFCCDEADVTGHQHLQEMLALTVKELIQSGEILVRHVYLSPEEMRAQGRATPYAVQLIESERIADQQFGVLGLPTANDGNPIRNGVEVDAETGRVVAFWLLDQHPNDVVLGMPTARRVTAEDIRHVFVRERIGQTRGIPWLAPAVVWLHRLGAYSEAEMMASALGACLMAVVKTDGSAEFGLNSPDGEDQDSNLNPFDHFEPGMVAKLGPNDTIDTINPGRPNVAAEAWINLIVRAISISLDLGYEALSRDHSKTNFSGQRSEELESRRRYKQITNFIVNTILQPIWERFVAINVLMGTEGFPTAEEYAANSDDWNYIQWVPEAREWVDPVKEQQAAQAEVDANMRTLADVCIERGRDLEDVLEQRKKEKELIKQYGLEPVVATPAGPGQKNNEPKAEEQPAGE